MQNAWRNQVAWIHGTSILVYQTVYNWLNEFGRGGTSKKEKCTEVD